MQTMSAGDSFKILSHAEIRDKRPIAENTVILSKDFGVKNLEAPNIYWCFSN